MGKFKLGISSCLLGLNVRYDGGNKLDCSLNEALGAFVEYVPVCPEVECGMGVPRELMRLEGDPANPHLVTTGSNLDCTDLLVSWAHKSVAELAAENLCGFIFKSNSPSCGMERVKVYNEKGIAIKAGMGIFARIFIECFPGLPVEDEESLRDPILREIFIKRILAMKRSNSILNKKRLKTK